MKTRPHKEEMIRFAKSKEGTAVWYRYKSGTKWDTLLKPVWSKPYIYILDNEYAELRKKSVDEDRPIQVYNTISSEWRTPPWELQFDSDIKNYRLEPKKEEFKYPIYKRSKVAGHIVEFIGEREGVVIKDTEHSRNINRNIGYESDKLIPHTNTNVWEDYDYVETIYYYRWEKLYPDGRIGISDLVTDEHANTCNYGKYGWIKITNTKRTWEDR